MQDNTISPRSLTLVLVQRDANTSQDTIINAYEEQEQLQATFDVEQYRKHGGADHFHLARLVAVDEQAMRTTASSDTPVVYISSAIAEAIFRLNIGLQRVVDPADGKTTSYIGGIINAGDIHYEEAFHALTLAYRRAAGDSISHGNFVTLCEEAESELSDFLVQANIAGQVHVKYTGDSTPNALFVSRFLADGLIAQGFDLKEHIDGEGECPDAIEGVVHIECDDQLNFEDLTNYVFEQHGYTGTPYAIDDSEETRDIMCELNAFRTSLYASYQKRINVYWE